MKNKSEKFVKIFSIIAFILITVGFLVGGPLEVVTIMVSLILLIFSTALLLL